MAPTLESLGIDQMSRADRIELMSALWESLTATPTEALLTDLQRTELRKRMAELDTSPELGIPWEQVKASIQ